MSQPLRSSTVLAYWLMPASPAREFFCEVMSRLVAQHEAPLVAPHLTLTAGPDDEAQAHRLLAGLDAAPIELRAAEVDYTREFTRTLFLRFVSISPLEQLRNSLGAEDQQPFDPHLSLLYQKISVEKQAELAASIKIPFRTIRFDAVQAVRCRVPVATAADVAAWHVVASVTLAR